MWAPVSTPKLRVSRFWSVCADDSSMELAGLLTASALAANLDPREPPAMNPTDGFPEVGSPKALSDGACSLGAATQVFTILDWSSLATESEKDLYETAFPELTGWRDRLEYDTQSYVITYDAAKKHILLVGGSPQGVMHATVSWLRDADHGYTDYRYRPDIPHLDWIPKHVLDYPELAMRVSLYPDMWGDMTTFIYPWANSVLWNRFTHVSNYTQLFALIARTSDSSDPESNPRLQQFDSQAAFFVPRHLRMIPRLYSGQVVSTEWMATPVEGDTEGTFPAGSDPGFLGPDPTGTLTPNSNEKQRGIHLLEGLRVPLEPGIPLRRPDQLIPVPKEQLLLARWNRCYFHPSPPEDLTTQNAGRPDCRTAYDPTTGAEEITLCKVGDLCPSVHGAVGSGLLIYPNLGDLGDVNDPADDIYGYKPGHVYLLAIHYRLPFEANSPANGTQVLYSAGIDQHEQNRYSTRHGADAGRDNDRLVPTGDSYAWASYIFRLPDANEVALRPPTTAISPPDVFVKIASDGQLGSTDEDTDEEGERVYRDTAVRIRDLQLFDLGETLAYPRVENADAPDYTTGIASCRAFAGASPACTMALDNWNRKYPHRLLSDRLEYCPPLGEDDPTLPPGCFACGEDCDLCPPAEPNCKLKRLSSLNVPTASSRANGSLSPGGSYRSALVPGLWPQAAFPNTGVTAASYPIELFADQAIESPDYWYNAPFNPSGFLSRGYLGVQLQMLHTLVARHRALFDPRFVDNTNAYTEARGFNRSQGLKPTPQTNLERYSMLYCRLLRELDRMGYDLFSPPESYTAGLAAMSTTSYSSCATNVQTSTLLYSDLFTPLHNGDKNYNTSYSGGSAWTPGSPDAFDARGFTHAPSDASVPRPTFAVWFNQDDPEMLEELFDHFRVRDYPVQFMMGAERRTDKYWQGRGNPWDVATLAAQNPESVYGATTWYPKEFAADGKMDAPDQRLWEQETADCMWNPNWSLVKLFEMKPEDLRHVDGYTADQRCSAYPNLTCIDAFTYDAAENGKYYGELTRTGTPESIQLNRTSLPTHFFAIEDHDLRRPNATPTARRVFVRGFARSASTTDTRFRFSLFDASGLIAKSEDITIHPGVFVPVEQVLTVPRGDMEVSMIFSLLSGAPVILDGFAVYEELPNFGLDTYMRPYFPSDVDERAAGLSPVGSPRYCRSSLSLQPLPVQP